MSANVETLNVAEDGDGNKFISDDKFSIALTVLNNDTKVYDNDITAILYEDNGSSNGKEMQRVVQHLTLGAGGRTTMQFDMADVVDGRVVMQDVDFNLPDKSVRRWLGDVVTHGGAAVIICRNSSKSHLINGCVCVIIF